MVLMRSPGDGTNEGLQQIVFTKDHNICFTAEIRKISRNYLQKPSLIWSSVSFHSEKKLDKTVRLRTCNCTVEIVSGPCIGFFIVERFVFFFYFRGVSFFIFYFSKIITLYIDFRKSVSKKKNKNTNKSKKTDIMT